MRLHNLMEEVVDHAIDDIKKHYDFCDCPQCRYDISAIALNKLPPRYVVSSKGESYCRAELLANQNNLDLMSVVLEAVKKVQQNPRH